MRWNDHSKLKDCHAFLSPSKYHWINYSDEKLVEYKNHFDAAQKGTELHEFAATCIRLGQKLPRSKVTLNMYVNDAIGFGMDPERTLFYSEYCFGTADSICFRDNTLRIHDLKTGTTIAHMDQLEVYAAIFCLEYGYLPKNIKIELRIYQNSSIEAITPEPEKIQFIMDKIVSSDKILRKLKQEE